MINLIINAYCSLQFAIGSLIRISISYKIMNRVQIKFIHQFLKPSISIKQTLVDHVTEDFNIVSSRSIPVLLYPFKH